MAEPQETSSTRPNAFGKHIAVKVSTPMKLVFHRIVAAILGGCLALPLVIAAAQTPAPWQQAEIARQALFATQLALLANEQQPAQEQLRTAQAALQAVAEQLQPVAPQAAESLMSTIADLKLAPAPQFAAARAGAWTAMLEGGMQATLAAIERNDPDAAQQWLKVRAFRTTTRVTRTSTDATEALTNWRNGSMGAQQAITSVRADLLDTYAALANTALTGIEEAAKRQNATSAAENAGMAAGYFAIVQDAYTQQRGEAQATQTRAQFDQLVAATIGAQWSDVSTHTAALQEALRGFTPTPLSDDEVAKKGTQILQFINLLQLEYGKGVRNGVVTVPLEVQEARTFYVQSKALLNEVSQAFTARDAQAAQQLSEQMAQLGVLLDQTGDPQAVTTAAKTSMALLTDRLGVSDQGGDISTITTLLDQVRTAVTQGDYATAEATRLQAYAIYEVNAEPKLLSRDGQLGSELEAMFWQGTQDQPGLATLISEKANPDAFVPTFAKLTSDFATAQSVLNTKMTPTSAIIGSIAILIREGLEAVLVIGAILGYMRATKAPRAASGAILGGAGIGILLSFVMWGLAQTVLTITPVNRELFEGIIGLVAAAILVYVTNWLLHKAYVTDWMAFIKHQVQQAMGRGSVLGLATLGFMVVFREGFETVLFFQALLFDAPGWSVAVGAVLGIAIISVIALVILRWSIRLPLKPFFTVTSALLLVLAVSFVGNGLRNLQEAGWIDVTRFDLVPIGYIPALFGLFPTVETVLGQVLLLVLLAVTFTIAKMRTQKQAVQVTRSAS